MVQNVILVFFRRRLSQRPAVEELESRNILKRECEQCRPFISFLKFVFTFSPLSNAIFNMNDLYFFSH